MNRALDPRAQRIVDAGVARYGKNWQSPLARIVKVSQSHIALLTSDDPAVRRPVTVAIEKKIAAGLGDEIKRLAEMTADLKRIRKEILANVKE